MGAFGEGVGQRSANSGPFLELLFAAGAARVGLGRYASSMFSIRQALPRSSMTNASLLDS